MDNSLAIFKKWVPNWLIYLTLIGSVVPNMVCFFLPMANIPVAAGYYGCEPADIQFSVILFYCGFGGFFALERRFFSFFAAKEYFILFTFLQIAITSLCGHVTSLPVFFVLRFLGGMLHASSSTMAMNLLLSRFNNERAREISSSIIFGLLLIALPMINLMTAPIIDTFNFYALYHFAATLYLPFFVLFLLTLNNVRFEKKFPLKSLDWQGFILFSGLFVLTGYMLIYGQERYWFSDRKMRLVLLAFLGFLAVFLVRQFSQKRPYVNLKVFVHRNFIIGLISLFILYIARFASSNTNAYFAQVLKLDPINISYLTVWNLIGTIAGVAVAAVLLLKRVGIRWIWVGGFSLLLFYYARMFFLFDIQANENAFYVPLFAQGFGAGILMTPTILFATSSVPPTMGVSASIVALTTRYLGFCASFAVMNYYELYSKSRHWNAFQDNITRLNPVVKQTLSANAHKLAAHGMLPQNAVKMANKLLVQSVNAQNQMRYAMDYYEVMTWILAITVLAIALMPYLNKTIFRTRAREIAAG